MYCLQPFATNYYYFDNNVDELFIYPTTQLLLLVNCFTAIIQDDLH